MKIQYFVAWMLALICAVAVAPVAVAETPTTVSLLGKVDGANYKMALEYHPSKDAPELAGLLVWAEPSHTLLLAHWNAEVRADVARQRIEEIDRPLVASEGVLGESHPRVILPYEPNGDRRVAVEALLPNGSTVLLLAGQVNVESFNVSSEFEVDPESNELKARTHCCSCGSCSKMCVDCAGAYFTCDCVGCSISCGW